MIKRHMLSASIISFVTMAVTPALADGIPKFGSTCVGNFGKSTNICISSNGKTVSSSYTFRGSIATKGTHTGCSSKADSITCTGGQYRTSQGDGAMTRVVISLNKGKPTAMAWR
jgi:hypothetical protein